MGGNRARGVFKDIVEWVVHKFEAGNKYTHARTHLCKAKYYRNKEPSHFSNGNQSIINVFSSDSFLLLLAYPLSTTILMYDDYAYPNRALLPARKKGQYIQSATKIPVIGMEMTQNTQK